MKKTKINNYLSIFLVALSLTSCTFSSNDSTDSTSNQYYSLKPVDTLRDFYLYEFTNNLSWKPVDNATGYEISIVYKNNSEIVLQTENTFIHFDNLMPSIADIDTFKIRAYKEENDKKEYSRYLTFKAEKVYADLLTSSSETLQRYYIDDVLRSAFDKHLSKEFATYYQVGYIEFVRIDPVLDEVRAYVGYSLTNGGYGIREITLKFENFEKEEDLLNIKCLSSTSNQVIRENNNSELDSFASLFDSSRDDLGKLSYYINDGYNASVVNIEKTSHYFNNYIKKETIGTKTGINAEQTYDMMATIKLEKNDDIKYAVCKYKVGWQNYDSYQKYEREENYLYLYKSGLKNKDAVKVEELEFIELDKYGKQLNFILDGGKYEEGGLIFQQIFKSINNAINTVCSKQPDIFTFE